MKTFKINNFLTLKLEHGFTKIYVKDILFIQCKYLILQKKSTELDDLLKIRSIDELELENDVEEEYDLEEYDDEVFPKIDTKTAFWAHCSNLQVWAEHNYDTRLLHSNLSFPLLKRLWQLEEPSAKIVFQEEIIRRFREGYINTGYFLSSEGYIGFLNEEEIKQILLNENDNLRETIKDCLKRKDQGYFKIALFLLEDLSSYNDKLARKFLKEFILDRIEVKDLEAINFLCRYDFFKIFDREELIKIFELEYIKELIKGNDLSMKDLVNKGNTTNLGEYLKELICFENLP